MKLLFICPHTTNSIFWCEKEERQILWCLTCGATKIKKFSRGAFSSINYGKSLSWRYPKIMRNNKQSNENKEGV